MEHYLRDITLMNMAYLYFLNKQHEKKRVSMGKSAKIIDHSMQAVGSVPVDKTEPQQPAVSEDNAFKDLTDWENEDFIYVY
ncbi:hypothetical protein APSETT445_007139 [Aspergillus pseudonomiae]